MTLVKCPNGHFYDSSRFGNNCPFCGSGSSVSQAADNGSQPTMPINPNDIPGGPAAVTEPLTQTGTSAAVSSAPPVQDSQVTIPVSSDILQEVQREPVVGWLVCVAGNNKGRDYCLHQGRNFIGRATEMDICIVGDNTVSRTSHAVVVYDPRSNVYLAQPGDSKELLYVNDTLTLSTVELKAKDKLSIGNTVLMFVPLCDSEFQWL